MADNDKRNPRQEMENLLLHIQGNEEIMESMQLPMARLMFFKYQALIKAGFTEQQAFTIILHRGLES